MDIKYAFLNWPLKKEVYVGQPLDFVVRNQELNFYKLKKVLYGFKKALRVWNKIIDDFLKEVAFKKCVSEYGVYVKTYTSEWVIILCLYVDDYLITGRNGKWILKFKSELMKEFEMTNLSLMTYFLGIKFHKSERGLFMHQRMYALDILKKFEMEDCNVVITSAGPKL